MSGGEEAGVDQAMPVILLFLFVGVVLKQVRKYLPSWFQLPYTVMMFLFGFAVTAIATALDAKLGRIGRSIDMWLGMHPHIILFVFLPPLLFESAFDMDYNVFQRVAGQATILAVPGVFLSLGLTACYLKAFFTEYDWGWDICLLLGSILSATDPVAVVAVLKTLGAPKRLASLIEGESLLNDGSAFVLFLIFKDMAKGVSQSGGDIVLTFAQLSLGGPAIGLAAAWASYGVLHFVYNDPLVEITGVVVVVFGLFFISELTFHVSSVLAVVVFGLFFAKEGKYALSREVHHVGHAIWAQIGHISNTVIFGISGLIFYDEVFNAESVYKDATNWWLLLLNFVMLHVVRFIVLAACFPLLRRMGYGLKWREVAIMWFGGLRGAVGLALGLLVQQDQGTGTHQIDPVDVRRINFHVAGIVCLTLLINGSLSGAFYKWVKPYPPTSSFKIRLFKKALEVLQLEQNEEVHELKKMWYFKGCQWGLVQDLLPNYNDIEFDCGHVTLTSMDSVQKCMRKARFKTLWEGGLRHALGVRSAGPKPSEGAVTAWAAQNNPGLAQSGGVADAVMNAIHKRASVEERKVYENGEHGVAPYLATPVKRSSLQGQGPENGLSNASISDRNLQGLGVRIMKPSGVSEEKSVASDAGEDAGGGGILRRRSLHKPSTVAVMRTKHLRPAVSVLMEGNPSQTAADVEDGDIVQKASSHLGSSALKSLRHMDVHKREEVCQIIFTTIKAYYHAMYEQRYLDSSAMLLLLDSLDKGNEAARKYNKDPGNPISVSWKRLRVDILQYRHMEKWMLGLPTKYSTTRALRAMFVYSRAKRSFEALHAFIDAYERILAGDDFRSDLDPEVTDDISESVKSAHELLVLLRESAPVAAGVLTALMATKVILNESLAKIEHLYQEEGMLDAGVKGELIDLVEARLFELHSFFPSPFVLGLKQQDANDHASGKKRRWFEASPNGSPTASRIDVKQREPQTQPAKPLPHSSNQSEPAIHHPPLSFAGTDTSAVGTTTDGAPAPKQAFT